MLKNTLFSRFFNFERILTETLGIDGHFLWSDMIESPFLSIPAKTACPEKLWLNFSKTFCVTRMADFKSSLVPLNTYCFNYNVFKVMRSQACMLHNPQLQLQLQ